MAKEIGIAMVGCGQIAEAHLKGVAAAEGGRLAFAVDADSGRAQSAAERYGAPRWSTSYAEALADPAVTAVVLCLPHDLHKPYAIQAAEAGKHILVEKPMALSEAEAREMVEAAARAGVRLSVGQSTRFMAPHRKARALLREGAVGRVIQAIQQRIFWIERLSTDWRRVPSACGGLYLPLFGSHDVDAMLWLLDDRPVRVWGAIRSESPVSPGDSDGFIGLEFSGGAIGSISFATRCRHARTETVFVGAEGTLVLTPKEVLLNGQAVGPLETEGNFVLQMRAFVEALRSGGEPPSPGHEVLAVVRTLDLVREASAKGKAMAF